MSLFAAAQARSELRQLPTMDNVGRNIFGFSSFFGGKTNSGINVTDENVMTLSAVYNAVTIFTQLIAQLPCNPIRKENDVSEKLKDHPSYRLLNIQANRYMSAYMARKVVMKHTLIAGNGYALIDRDGFGNPVSIFPLEPHRVQPHIIDGDMVYEVDGTEWISANNMIHIINHSENGLMGIPLVYLAAESMGMSLATERYGSQFYGNGANPSGFIKIKGMLKDKAAVTRLKDSFVKSNAGIKNAQGVGVLENDSDWVPTTVDPEKAQALQTRQFSITEVARWLNMPVPFLKELGRATWSNLEQLDLQLNKYSLEGHFKNLEQVYAMRLLSTAELREGNTTFKHNVNAFLKGDAATRSSFYKNMVEIGAYSPNDVRRLEDENPYEGGDVHVIHSGAQTIEQLQGNDGNSI